jgi:hypothetical protein
MRFLVWGTIPVGMIIGGAIASVPAFGARGALAVGGILGCFAFVPILFSSVRSLERIPTPEPAPSDEALLATDADVAAPGPTLD